ncbi:MAG: multiheme c-type cytochrome [Rhodothermales bacterium]
MQSWPLLFLGSLLGLGLVLPITAFFQDETNLSDSPYLRIDPEKIVIDDKDPRIPCGECHNLEFETWRETKHATGFDNLHRTDRAQAILDNMDLSQSKRESLCLKCHYTANIKRDKVQAVAGVSCESCHGAARDWVNIHQDYGGATRETESEEHKAMRVNQAITNGMLRPSSNLYAVTANCFECHTVPEEKLVNTGGHLVGRADFDLIARVDLIRHNFVAAQWGGSEANRPISPERKRLMYVVGKALSYEYSIRGAAQATTEGNYAKGMESLVKKARRDLDEILRVVSIPEIAQIVSIGKDLRIVPNNERALLAAADRISEQGQAFVREHDGSAFAALDPLVRGERAAPAEAEAEVVVAEVEGNDYERRTRPAWFPTLNEATVAPGGCSCHGSGDTVSGIDKLAWHANDKHSQAADPLLTESVRAVQIASAYGLSPTQMKQGNQLCMNCHGTIVTGDEAFEVDAGVDCQNCHGPAGEYQFQHQSGGYEQGAEHGMVRLEDASVRATNCARCHHITDERLLAAGHSTGASFRLGERNGRIQHWAEPTISTASLNDAYTAAISSRPVPDVEVIDPPPPPPADERPTPPAPTPDAEAADEPVAGTPEVRPTRQPAPPPANVVVASVVGERRQQPSWFPTFRQSTLAPLQNCGCHGGQLSWHRGDKHSASAEPLLNASPRAVQIAQNYGLSTSQMKQGNQLCMSCHGSVETGQESEEVFDGVSCQSCHGPASEYLSSHPRDKYAGSASKGMVQLEQAAARANNCARCHHITDERLLSAGHSDGSSFQLASRNDAIKHWEGPTLSASALNSAYASAIGSRPVPTVARADLPPVTTTSSRPRRASSGSASSSSGSSVSRPQPPRPRPVQGFEPPPAGGSGVATSSGTAVSDTTSTEDILLLIKRRLESLHRRLGQGQ